ncbi:MAG: Nif3-like dinuclear metal center hexameric protein [Clostridia bacterium]
MKVLDIYNLIDKIAPFNTAMSFDNVGILCGNSENSVEKILICLDITDAVIEEAKGLSANLIISHHPVIFDPIKKIDSNSILAKLIKNDINAIACHTNIDKCEKLGTNRALADKLGFKEIQASENGEYFVLNLKTNVKNLANHIKNCFPNCNLQFSNFDSDIKKIALCSGAGSTVIYDNESIDALITGEIKHDAWLEAMHKNIAIFAFGHYDTEILYCEQLQKYLQKNTEEEIYISKKELNPIRVI